MAAMGFNREQRHEDDDDDYYYYIFELPLFICTKCTNTMGKNTFFKLQSMALSQLHSQAKWRPQ